MEKEDCNPQKSLPVATSEPDFPRTIMPQEDFERCRQHKLSGVVHLLDDVGGCRVAERCQEIMDPCLRDSRDWLASVLPAVCQNSRQVRADGNPI